MLNCLRGTRWFSTAEDFNQNQTAYELTVLVAGPVERSLSIPSGGSQGVELPPGKYRVVGQVKASDILPFFGAQAYATGNSYDEAFYIK
jgi:hypothetical protein